MSEIRISLGQNLNIENNNLALNGLATFTSQPEYSSAISSEIYKTDTIRALSNDAYIDLAHITGTYLPNGNFIQVIGAFSSANYLLLTETNTSTGVIESIKYPWNTDSPHISNVTADGSSYAYNGIYYSPAEAKLYSDSNSIVFLGQLGYASDPSCFVKCDLSYNIISSYQISGASTVEYPQVGNDGNYYLANTGYGNSGTTTIAKYDPSTGNGLAQLTIPYAGGYKDTIYRVDSSGNLYLVFGTNGGASSEYNTKGPWIAKYSWNGTGYDNVWQKIFDVKQDDQFCEAVQLDDNALYVQCQGKVYSFNLLTGNINWSKDFSFTNFSLPSDYTPLDSYTTGLVTDSSGNVYIRTWFRDAYPYEGYSPHRFFAIQKYDSSGNFIDCIIIEAPPGVTYGQWYADQHYMYCNENKLVIPCLKNYLTKSSDAYDPEYLQLGIDTIILDTNLSSNIGISGKFGDYKIVNPGTIYTDVSSSQTVSDDVRVATNQATPSISLVSVSNVAIYDDTVVTGTLFDHETSATKYKTSNKVLSVNGDYDLLELNSVALSPITTKSISIKSYGSQNYTIGQGDVYNNFSGLIIDNVDTLFRVGNVLKTGFGSVQLGRSLNLSPQASSVQIGDNIKNTNSYNTLIGNEAGASSYHNSGSYCTHVGQQSGRGGGYTATPPIQIGSYNSSLGARSQSNSIGSNCISIGYLSTGRVAHTGDNQITIGNISQPDPSASTCLAIGHHTSVSFSGPDSYWIVGNENFNVGFGINDPQTKVAIDGVLGFGASTDNIKIGDNENAKYIDDNSNISLGRSAGRGRTNSISSGGAAFTITSSTAVGGSATFTDIYPSGGSGTNAIVKVTRNSSGVVTSVSTDTDDLSEGYQVGDVLTINGSNVGGVTGVDDITVTIASVNASQFNVEENIFIGSCAGRNIGAGSYNNVFIGQCAGFYSTYALRNVYIGQNAGLPNTRGIENIAIGHGAGNNWSGGYAQGNGNTFLGYYAGSTYDGFGNTAIGYRTGEKNTTGDYNAFLGSGSGASNTTGSCNSFSGNYSGAFNTTGVLNTANGYLAGSSNNIGSTNTFLGACAGYNSTSGSNNILIGWRSGTTNGVCNVTTESNYIVMGNNAHTCALIQVGWTTVSDTRDKCIYGNVKHGRGFLQNITPIEYTFKDRETGCLTDPEGKRRYGFSAQNILEAEGTDNPVIVSNDNPEKLQITSDYLIPVLVNAVNELSEEIDKLRSEINQLKSSA